MNKHFIIVGLRALNPLPVGFGSDRLPGYLSAATSNHRRGFQLPGIEGWFAFVTNPLSACLFESEDEALPWLQALLDADKGTFRPLALMPVYQ